MKIGKKLPSKTHLVIAQKMLSLKMIMAIGISTLSLFVFILMTAFFARGEFVFVDSVVSSWVASVRTPFLTQIMLFITLFGREFIVFFGVLFFAFLVYKRQIWEALFATFVVGSGVLLNLLLKLLIQRPRPPFAGMVLEETYSYPSGHAMSSVLFYALVAYLILRATRNRLVSGVVLAGAGTLVLLVSFSRVYLGVHYASDVIAGMVGGIWYFVTLCIVEKILTRRTSRQ